MPSVVRWCSCSVWTTRHFGVLDEGCLCSSFSLLPNVFASLSAKCCCCLESKITGAGVSPDFLINTSLGVVGSTPGMDLVCHLKRCWKLFHLPTTLGSHQSSLPYSATAWTQATWTACTLSGSTLCVLVSGRSLASADQIPVIHRLWCSLNVRCVYIQMRSQHIACWLNCMNNSRLPSLLPALAGGVPSRLACAYRGPVLSLPYCTVPCIY
jgi:hypothetical protein